MATFRIHISFGLALGILGSLFVSSLALVDAPSFLITLAVLVTLGSVLPDMDSDSSVPFHVAFGSLTIVVSSLVFASVYTDNPQNWRSALLMASVIGVVLWVGVGFVFKRFTRHRGIVHSIPATILTSLGTFFSAEYFGYSDPDAFLLAVAIAVGFLIHLILDEVWAMVNFHGHLFEPNKAFGSALKFKSHNKIINLVVYGSILFLVYGNMDRFMNLTRSFWQAVH